MIELQRGEGYSYNKCFFDLFDLISRTRNVVFYQYDKVIRTNVYQTVLVVATPTQVYRYFDPMVGKVLQAYSHNKLVCCYQFDTERIGFYRVLP